MYELLLTGAVTAIAALLAGIAAIFLNPVSQLLSSLVTCVIFVGSWWLYFKTNWTKTGRTLAMQTWKIGLHGRNGTLPPLSQLRIRFIWSCIFVVFIPLLAYAGLRHLLAIPPIPAFGAALIWLILPWGFALLNPDRQFFIRFLGGNAIGRFKTGNIRKLIVSLLFSHIKRSSETCLVFRDLFYSFQNNRIKCASA